MTGTLVNVLTVLVGGSLGLVFGNRLSARMKGTIISGLGLFTGALGLRMFILYTENPLIVLGCLLVGALLGEWWRIEDGLQVFGEWVQKRVNRSNGGEGQGEDRSRFTQGFLSASLLFCVGPMTILGSLQDGLSGDSSTLVTKAVLDGFAALALASSLGPGVLFAAVVVLLYQGGLSLLAGLLSPLLTEGMMAEMTATGGILLIGIAVSSLLAIKPLRVGNYLPALALAPLLTRLLELLK